MFQLIRSFSTARIFAEFGIELFDGTLLNQCYDIMRHLGDVKVKETRRNTYIIDYNTETTDVKEIEHLSNDICKKIDIIKSEMKEFVNMFSERIYADICFVKVSDEKEHLLILQEKINVYILFYESQQYKQCDSNYAKAPIEYVVIEIHSKYALPSLAIQFLEHVQEQINELGIIVECHITGDGTDEN